MQDLTVTMQVNAQQLVESIVKVITLAFDQRILSIYLGGSYNRGQLTPSSDLDLTVVFREAVTAEEETRFMALRAALQPLSPFRLDMWPEAETKMKARPANANIRSSHCIYGEHFLHTVPAQSIDAFAMRSIHKAINYMTILRGRPAPNPAPLTYPDGYDRYYGYTTYGDFAEVGAFQPGTRIIVDMVAQCTTACIALEQGVEMQTKQESIAHYAATIGGQWADFVQDLYATLKTRFSYQLPDAPEDQDHLRTLLHNLLAFENDCLAVFKPVILTNLHATDDRKRKLALVALKNIQLDDFKHADVLDALANFKK